jgi:hypothetical protein
MPAKSFRRFFERLFPNKCVSVVPGALSCKGQHRILAALLSVSEAIGTAAPGANDSTGPGPQCLENQIRSPSVVLVKQADATRCFRVRAEERHLRFVKSI